MNTPCRLVSCLSACILLATLFAPAPAHAQFKFTTVVLDAGHGGKDPGCIWYNRVEKHLALDVAKRVETALRAKGIKTAMTRRTDIFVELDQRAKLANRFSNALFVSIHFNASKDTSKSGAEMHYRSGKGLALARILESAFDKGVKLGCTNLVQRDRLVVLRETNMPAVLVECGYISHKGNSWLCAQAFHRQNVANAIVSGLLAAKAK